MSKSESSQSESEENVSSEDGVPKNPRNLSNYELQRLKRIEENKKRMEALGLHKIANSFMGSVKKTPKMNYEQKGKKKIADEDDEYNPTEEDDEGISSSAEEDEMKRNSSTPKKRGSIQRPVPDSDFVEDDDALMQAIALSLQDSVSSKTSTKDTIDAASDKIKGNSYAGNDSVKGLQISSRVQMAEDEMIVHFFQFDETGKGGINTRDVQRLAIAHDFTWSEKEMADMISCFDSDGDGKINFDDFRKIVCRCNMLKGSD
ncbi:hypothetical protein PHJA_001642000 [Phtheirospermum japonicum]|uniref:EF-hand domain-containing protein n=1 Tax=Phtheirospermum japonicum TaxID=374723 RepID=A0A830C781_9LAMI|nr:hypothetical protein PHJA_001642000 [Phtheirospermum japonicum]